MSAHLAHSLGVGVGALPRSSAGPCNYALVGWSGDRNFRSEGSVSTSFSKAVSSVDAFKLVATSRTGGRRVFVGVAKAAALFPFLGGKKKDVAKVKIELLDAIAPLDRGANATPDDLARVDQIATQLEKLNPTKEPLKSPLLNGKWKLIYTTSETILKKSRPRFLRPNGPIYQAINTDTLRAQNLETWPYFNQVTADLVPVNSKKVIVNFDFFKIAGLSICSYYRTMDVAGRFLHRVSMTLSLVELCIQGYTAVVTAGHNKVAETCDSKCADCKKPVAFSVEPQPVYSDDPDTKWCGLCGAGEGWMRCGSCMGEGGYVTKPGLAGVKGRVGWARCKTCFGQKILSCLLCGSNDAGEKQKRPKGIGAPSSKICMTSDQL